MSEIQPAGADAFSVGFTGGVGGCGFIVGKTISFAPGSSVSVSLKGHAHRPFEYAPSGGSENGDGVFTLQS